MRHGSTGYTRCHLPVWCSDPPLPILQVPLKTTDRRRLRASDNLLRGTNVQECVITKDGVKECIDGEMIWELADPDMTDIPPGFLQYNTDLTGTLKLGAAVKTIGKQAFYKTKLTGLDLSNATSLVSIGVAAFQYTDITGTLVIPAKVETIGGGAFYDTDITGLDLSDAASLESIGDFAFGITDITGTLVIPANVETIGDYAFDSTKLTGLDLSNAASLVSIDVRAFYSTDITGTIVTPFTVPTYAANFNSFPAGVTIVKG